MIDKGWNQEHLTQLRQILAAHLSDEELHTLCFDLGIDYADLPGEGRAGKARELIALLDRYGRIPELVGVGSKLYPHILWGSLLVLIEEAPVESRNILKKIAAPGLKSARDQRNQAILEDYFRVMGDLLREGLGGPEDKNGRSRLARAHTIMVLRSLEADGRRKGQVIEFLYASQLINAGLSVVSLSQADLTNAILDNTNLQQANLADANLTGARLTKANLMKADFSGANLTGARMVKANLQGADLTRANLSQTSLKRASLIKAKLRRAILCGADLNQADLTYANLSKADLRQADLWDAELLGARLEDVRLEGANLEGSAEIAGQVMAGTGDVKLYMTELEEGEMYRFEVVGNSMEHEDIYEGDYVIVRASNKHSSVGDTIVTMYVSAGKTKKVSRGRHLVVLGSPVDKSKLSGPTVKVFHEPVGSGGVLLGWKKSIKGHKPIMAKHIVPIGKVVAIYPVSRRWKGCEE